MPKGQMPKLKGVICNISVLVNETSWTLPRTLDLWIIIFVKLRKILEFSGYVYFEPVSTEKIINAFLYLKKQNSLYNDVIINLHNIPIELLSLNEDQKNRYRDRDKWRNNWFIWRESPKNLCLSCIKWAYWHSTWRR